MIASLAGFLSGREAHCEMADGVATPQPVPSEPVSPATSTLPQDADGDRIADKPQAVKSGELLGDLQPSGMVNMTARRCFALLADMKKNAERISADLDDNGREVNRLILTSENLSKNITELAALWPQDASFRDQCSSTKRNALILNDELSRKPLRKWSHVRWAFSAALQDVSRLRLRARDLAEAEPKPVREIGKDGKVYYVEPPEPVPTGEAAIGAAKSEATKAELQQMRNKMKHIEEVRKSQNMPVDLDSTRK